MKKTLQNINPKFLVDGRGCKMGILLSLKEFRKFEEMIEDFEDTIDLLRAEREAIAFTPYEEFRKTWLST